MSSIYKPDKWVVLKIVNAEEPLFKIFGSWSSSYTTGESWRLNSGITECRRNREMTRTLDFYGHSGSVYRVNPEMYGVAGIYSQSIIQPYLEKGTMELLPETTDWLNFQYV